MLEAEATEDKGDDSINLKERTGKEAWQHTVVHTLQFQLKMTRFYR